MHELSLCERILQILEDEGSRQGYECVKAVWLELGDLACIDEQALRFSFDVVVKGTLADQAKLHIERCEGKAWCEQCLMDVVIHQLGDCCPHCAGFQLRIARGTEMRIKEIEVN